MKEFKEWQNLNDKLQIQKMKKKRTISSGLRIPNCTRLTVRRGARKSMPTNAIVR